jgi:hypothetical protein
VLKLLLLRLNTSSNTNAPAAVSRGKEFDSSEPSDQLLFKQQTIFRMFDSIFISETIVARSSQMHFSDYADGISSFVTVHSYCLLLLGICVFK